MGVMSAATSSNSSWIRRLLADRHVQDGDHGERQAERHAVQDRVVVGGLEARGDGARQQQLGHRQLGQPAEDQARQGDAELAGRQVCARTY